MATSFTDLVQFFPELEGFILDPTVKFIHVNNDGGVFIRRFGGEADERIAWEMFTQERLRTDLSSIAEMVQGTKAGAAQQILTVDLDDGSYVSAVFPPGAVDGATVTLSRVPSQFQESARATVS